MSGQYNLSGLKKGKYEDTFNGYLSAKYPVMFLPILFDEERLITEFERLPTKLKKMVWFAATHVNSEWNVPLVLTHIFRTKNEQNEFYSGDKKYQENPWSSPHQDYRAVDIRLTDMGIKAAKELAEIINDLFPYDEDRTRNAALVHDVGLGAHIHFQVKRD